MVLRPRTKLKKANRNKRCSKCGAMILKNGKVVRCRKCAKVVS